VAVNKQSFYDGISQDTVFDEAFFKKVLGYSMYDKPFLEAVAVKLTGIGRKDVADRYNAWYAAWKANDDAEMKKVAEWYRKELDKDFKERQKKAVEDWKRNLQNLTNSDLLTLLENAKEGFQRKNQI